MAKTNAEVNKEIDDFIAEVKPVGEAKELTVAELQQEIFNVKLRYDYLLNYLKPLLSHDALVLLSEKKKEIFG